jgi:hypothetical protein
MFLFTVDAHAAVKTWNGGGSTNNWSEGANWVGGTAPGSSDIATFDGTSTKDATIDGSFGGNVSGIDINTGYTGTITMARSMFFGGSGYDQADGTFAAASYGFDDDGAFTLSGGTFTPTSGSWTLQGNLTVSGGTLNGTGKSVTLDGCVDGTITYSGDLTGTTGLAISLNKFCAGHMTVSSGTTVAVSPISTESQIVVDSGATLTTVGNAVMRTLTNNGSFTAGAGTFSVGIAATFSGTTNNLNAVITSVDFGDLTIGSGSTLTLNPALTTISLTGAYTNSGTFSLTGRTLSFGGCSGTGSITYTGDFNADTGAAVTIAKGCNSTFNVPSGQTLTAAATNSANIVIAAGGSLTSTGNFSADTLNNSGTFIAGSGTFTVNSTATFGGTTNNLNAVTTSMSAGNLTISGGSTLTLNPAVTTVGIIGFYTNNGTFDISGRTLSFSGCAGFSGINYTGNFNADTGASVTVGKFCNATFTIPSGQTLTSAFTNTANVVIAAGGTLITTGNFSAENLNNSGSFTAGAGTFTVTNATTFSGTTNDLSAVITSGYLGGLVTVGSGKTVNMAPVTYRMGSGISNSGTITSSGTITLLSDIAFGPTTTLTSSSVIPANITVNHIFNEVFTLTGDFSISGNFVRTNGPITNPSSAYTFSVGGNVTVDSASNFGGSNFTLRLNGTGTQTITNSVPIATAFNVNKASGSAVLGTSMTVTTYACTVTAGTFDLSGYPFTCSTGFTISSGATLQLVGSEVLTTPTLNSGSTVKYVGDGDSSSDSYALKDFTYSNLTINPTDSGDTFGGTGTNTLTSGLVSYYPFDEGSGSTTADGSGNGYTGSLVNMEAGDWSADVPSSNFTNSYSLDFDGVDEAISLGNPALLPAGASARSVCGWGKTDSTSGNRWMYSYGTGSNTNAYLWGLSGSSLYGAGWAADISYASFWTTGAWKYTCFVYTGTVERLYTGGTLLASNTVALNTIRSSAYIGRLMASAGDYWDGKIDDVRVYDRALSLVEMEALANGYNTTAATITSLTVNGNLTLASGTLTLPSGTTTVSGNLVKTGGTFDANGGTVNLGTGSQSISGTWTFANLTKNVSSAATLTLPAGVTTTVTGAVDWTGESGQLLSLRSSTPTSAAIIDPQGGRTLEYLDVQDSYNANASAMNCGATCFDSLRNTNWIFAAGISVSSISGNTTEAGGTATFTVVLDGEPTSDVTIPVSSSDTTEGTVSTSLLTFTTGNWDTPQTVTVTGVNDEIADGNIAYSIVLDPASSSDDNYNDLDPSDVPVTNNDNDNASITVGTISGNTTEAGGTATFTVVLTSKPSANVSIGVSSSDTSEGTVSAATLTFTDVNWNIAQTVTVTGVDDFIDDGDIGYTIILGAASSADAGYNGVNPADVSVTNTDNDTVGFTVSAITGHTTEAGGTATFTVTLNTLPSDNVVVGVTSSDTTEGTVSPSSLTFTTGNWSTAHTVTVTGVNDEIVDGNIAYTAVLAAATSTDTDYNGLNPADVSVTNDDNDSAGFTISAISGNTSEDGDTATFTVQLNSEPTDDVVVGVSSSDTSEGTVLPASLTFTMLDWDTPQTVTVTGVDDALIDGDIGYTIILAAAVSADSTYNGINPSDVSVTNEDNDTIGITVSTISGSTSELGSTATFTVVLESQPTSDVLIPVSSSDTSEGTVAISSLTFTNVNWETPQTVTVTGVDDMIDDGDIGYSIVLAAAISSDINYNGLNPSDVSVTNIDNDLSDFTIGAISGNTTEAGGTATFTVHLNSQPASDVVIPVSSSDLTEGTVSPSTLTFTNGNWSSNQTVTVTGVDDLINDGDIFYSAVLGVVTTSDPGYSGANPADVGVTNTDDENAGFSISAISGNTTESGGTATFTVRLTSQPTGDVVIAVSSTDTTEGTVAISSLTFTNGNWNSNQTVTVTGVNDYLDDGNIGYTIVLGVAASSDTDYNGLNPADVSVTNTDNDISGFSVSTISGNTTEAGGTATLTVALTAQPTADVLVSVISSDTTEGTVSTSGLTFTDSDWNSPQTITVTGVNDFVDDGNVVYSIVLGAGVSGDTNYNTLDPNDVPVTTIDDDTAGVTVTASGGSTLVSEDGDTDTYTIVLTSQPTSSVTISISPDVDLETDLSEVIFTTVNWSTPRTVTVSAVDDLFNEGRHGGVITHAASSVDGLYNGYSVASLSVTIEDNDGSGPGGSGYIPPDEREIVVERPPEGITIPGGSDYLITWSWEGGIDYVNVSYSTDGTSFTPIAEDARNSGSLLWHAPQVGTSNAIIKVSGSDLAVEYATALSEPFTIEQSAMPIMELPDMALSPITGKLEPVTKIKVGDFIRSPGFTTVYYVDEGFVRRPFLDAQTYFTYKDNFLNLVGVTDATLPTMPLGKPMLPMAKRVLVKITTDPTVYSIGDDGLLHRIPDEETAGMLYGSDWADYVIDLNLILFMHFDVGEVMTKTDIVDRSIMKKRFYLF